MNERLRRWRSGATRGIVFGIIFVLGVAAVGGGFLMAAEEPRPGETPSRPLSASELFDLETKAEELTAWDHIQVALDRVYDLTWPMATALAGVGIATMAVFQMTKDLFHVRRRFYEKRVREWLKDRAAAKAGTDAERAEKSLVTLATAGDAEALYSLEIDKLAGQINAAARMALDYPKGHEDLINCLAAQADAGDLQKVLNPPATPAPSAGEEEKKRARDQAAVYLEAKNRVATHIQRTLDGFQIMQEYRWKHWNQVWAFWLNFAFVMIVLVVNSYRAGGYRTDTPAYVLVALLGGFVAPVAKDLVSALEALKGRKR